jgi:hypothetical protein
MTTTDESTFDIGIACSLTADERVERGGSWEELLREAEEVVELAAGYALRFANLDDWIARAAHQIVAERKCCPFFRFALAFEPNGGPVWLHVEGPADVKEFIRQQMVPPHLQASS